MKMKNRVTWKGSRRGVAWAVRSGPDLEFRNDLPQKIVGVEPPETDQNGPPGLMSSLRPFRMNSDDAFAKSMRIGGSWKQEGSLSHIHTYPEKFIAKGK